MFIIKITNKWTNNSYAYPIIYSNVESANFAINEKCRNIKQIPQARSINNKLEILPC